MLVLVCPLAHTPYTVSDVPEWVTVSEPLGPIDPLWPASVVYVIAMGSLLTICQVAGAMQVVVVWCAEAMDGARTATQNARAVRAIRRRIMMLVSF